MTPVDRQRLKREYKETTRPAGVFVVRNLETGGVLVGTSADLPGMLNRQRFQLELGSHPDQELQADWNQLGPGAFEFEVLDQLEPNDEGDVQEAELSTLQLLWVDRLEADGVTLYPQSRRGI